MTLKDLIKSIPEEYHDCLIEIEIPQLRAGDEGTFPLIQYMIDDIPNKSIRIILIADIY